MLSLSYNGPISPIKIDSVKIVIRSEMGLTQPRARVYAHFPDLFGFKSRCAIFSDDRSGVCRGTFSMNSMAKL